MAEVWSDERKLASWLEVELAAVDAWAELGVVPREAAEAIRAARRSAHRRSGSPSSSARPNHDLAAFVDAVQAELGEEGRWLHYGLTSSDVVDTALALQLRDAGALLLEGIARAQAAVVRRAEEHRLTLCIGRTHGVHAEPTTFGLKLAGWAFELDRGRERLEHALAGVRFGKLSGAVGTYSVTDPELERIACERLGLEPEPVSTQIVPRDRHAELLSALALVASSLDRFATEIRHLARTEVREVQEPFGKGQKGSSAMPHKRNPIVAERICGLARVVRADAQVGLENVALWHERDISHSSAERVVLPDAFLALDYMLDRFTWLVEGLVVFPERMRANLEASHGLFFSQRVLLALVEGGLPRDEAYRLVQGHALRAWDEGLDFRALVEGGRAHRRPDRPRRRLRPRRVHTPRRRGLRPTPRPDRQPGGRPCLRRSPTSRAARSASCSRSTTSGCCSSPATGSRPSTSCCRPRSPTRAASSPASRRSGSRARGTSARTTCSRCAPDGRSTECRRLEMLPLECVVRGYLAGSGWKDYQRTGATSGHVLPEGLRESDRLPEPIFTPSTKATSGHDENIDAEQAVALVGRERYEQVERTALELYRFASEHAAARGILIADTKFEFGLDGDGAPRARRRGVHARLVPLLAGRRVRAGRRRSRPSTSSSSATTARRSAGTRRRPARSCRTTSSPALARATSRRSSA